MKSEKIINAFNEIKPDKAAKERILEKMQQEKSGKKPILRTTAVITAVAAMLCFMLFGTKIITPQRNNLFSINAYAVEQQADGSLDLQKVDLVEPGGDWGGIYYNDKFFINIGVKCDGENIKSVQFSTENGFFVKQDISKSSSSEEDSVVFVYVSGSDRPVLHGLEFEELGSTFSLSKSVTADDTLIFWGMESAEADIPSKITFDAVATFHDGTTQKEAVTIDIKNRAGIVLVDNVGGAAIVSED